MITKINRKALTGLGRRFLPASANYYLLFFISYFFSAALTSCNDIVNYNDGYTPAELVANDGAPVITAVYDVADTKQENPITEGTINQMVTIVGHNLNRVKSVKFNTVECDMQNVYTASTKAVVQIPSKLSLEQVNKIEYTTEQGSTSYDFTIPFPDLTVSGLDCEFKNGGQPVVINGQNFDIYGFDEGISKVTLITTTQQPSPTTLTPTDITAKSMTVTIPEGTPDNSTLRVEWTCKGQTMTADLAYRPTKHLLYGSYEGVSFNIDGAVKDGLTIEDDGSVSGATASLGNKHLHITGAYSAWSWNTIDLSCNMVEAEGDLSTLDDYVLRFEVLTAKSFPMPVETGLKFNFNWGSDWQWNIGDGAGITTNGDWATVTLPLSSMATKGISRPGTWQTLRIIMQPQVAMDLDFRMGNFRIERK